MDTVQKVEQVKHLPIKFGEVARYVIVPGDPNRVPLIAESLDNPIHQGQKREFNAYKGTYKGIEVSVVSTGIGCPSTAIAVEELAHIGAEVFIRIGTSGSVDKSAKKGDIFIATAAVRDDGTSKQYIPIEFPAVASHNVVDNLINASKDLSIQTKVGICQSKDSFFGETEPERMPISPYLNYKWSSWQKGGVGASEMEAATLFTLSQIKNIQAGAILAIETSDKEIVQNMTKIVLESINYMEGNRNVE
jgi:uridine phosphorylase|tara:strand:- start:2459 stop:3202 length:744 start_codon:yes stop_codon:yes gene_type:complete